MASLSGLASQGLFGLGAGAYATNKGFRKGVNSFMFGEKPHVEQLANFSPQQNQAQSQILNLLNQSSGQGGAANNAQNYFANMLQPGQEAFNNFSQPYMQQFQEQILPGIAERFAGAGALSSSGFGQALGGAASGLQSNLAQLFSQLQMQSAQGANSQFGQLGQFGFASPFTNYENPGHQGFAAQLIAALMKGGMGGLS